jgi:hypothetical protein
MASADLLPSAIPLQVQGTCPHCQRPLLGFASNTCSGCGRSLENDWGSIPGFASRLEAMAPGWTTRELEAWAEPLPAFLAWAILERAFPLLNRFVSEDLWGGWARLWASQKGRGRTLAIDDVAVRRIRLIALGDFRPWAALRVQGTRSMFYADSSSGLSLGDASPRDFEEFWFLRFTGAPEPKAAPTCTVCGAGLDLRDRACTYCGCPQVPGFGPWLVEHIQSLRQNPEELAPFSGGTIGAGFRLSPRPS